MTDREAKCEDRIAEAMEGREDDVALLMAAQNGDTVCVHCHEVLDEEDVTPDDAPDDAEPVFAWVDSRSDATCVTREEKGDEDPVHEPDTENNEDSIYEFGLGISAKVILRYELSTGGPGDWLEIELDPNDRMRYMGATYHYNDWFDHAERPVSDGTALDRFCAWVAETHADGILGTRSQW